MHILIIPSWYPNSSSSLSGIFFKEQAEGLAIHGHKIGLIAIQNPFSIIDVFLGKKPLFKRYYYIEKGVITYRLEYPTFPKIKRIRDSIKIQIFKIVFKKYIYENGLPDIVHLHSFSLGEFAIWIKENYNIPYIVTEHTSGFERKLFSKVDIALAHRVYTKSSFNIAVSHDYVNLLHELFKINFTFIPNIVNPIFFTDSIKEIKRIESFVFINVAGLNENKNHSMLIRSFDKAFKNLPNIKLVIVGNGCEYNNLKSLISKLNMQKQIKLFGKANRNEVDHLLKNSNAFVVSSNYETFGISIVEAMANGLPVISTKCGGPESIIVSPELGLLCERTENSLTSGLLEIYQNRINYEPSFIKNYAFENYSSDVVCNKLLTIYSSIINNKEREIK